MVIVTGPSPIKTPHSGLKVRRSGHVDHQPDSSLAMEELDSPQAAKGETLRILRICLHRCNQGAKLTPRELTIIRFYLQIPFLT